MQDVGLPLGKMGIVLAMSDYSKFTSNEIYFEVASCLLDDIMEKMYKNLDYSFSTGLFGIGWGIEYLPAYSICLVSFNSETEEFDILVSLIGVSGGIGYFLIKISANKVK